MSSIPGGGGNLYIAPGANAYYVITWNNSGWQGNTLIQTQPLNTGTSLTVTQGGIDLDSSGHYQFDYMVHNNGPNSTYFNVQVSSN